MKCLSKFGNVSALFSKDGEFTFYPNYGLMDSGLCDGYTQAPLWQQAIEFLKSRKVLVAELWDGWECGAYDEDFIYCETREEAVTRALQIVEAQIAQ